MAGATREAVLKRRDRGCVQSLGSGPGRDSACLLRERMNTETRRVVGAIRLDWSLQ